MEFTKPARNTAELIAEWKNRGLMIDDANRIKRYLDFIGYYRLSAYTIPFQPNYPSSHQFKSGTSFDDILNCYVFDRELRLLILNAIERVEVAVRAQITNVISLDTSFCKPNGAFWYLNREYFHHEYEHQQLLTNIQKQLSDERNRLNKEIQTIENNKKLSPIQKKHKINQKQKENFLRHYLSHYDQPELPPCWVMMETLTLGELSRLYKGLKSNALKKKIAVNLGVNAELLSSWLLSFTSIRNFCAHHSRLWNRELGVSLKIPHSSQVKWLSKQPNHPINYQKRIYSVLIALQTILYTISPNSSWAKQLKQLLEKYPNISIHNMEIPNDWHTDSFWQDALN